MKAWVVRSGRKGNDFSDRFWDASVAAIGYGVGSMLGVTTRDGVKNKLKVERPDWKDGQVTRNAGIFHRFKNEIDNGDLIITPPAGQDELLLGYCRGPYQYSGETLSEDMPHIRKVDWFMKTLKSNFSERFLQSISSETVVWNATKYIAEIEAVLGANAFNSWSEADLSSLANDLLLPPEFLQDIWSLLQDKKQVIFQGPPGTGKTYVAQALAKHLAGSEDHVTLVQFHPSYAYEDFVQGYRPTLTDGTDGQVKFELRKGPLLQAAERASKASEEEPDTPYFLIIDEINRGNLAKVFGELYFLLEYRDREINLQYSDEPFSLPKNLYIIGTMNTADRSIARVDLALRRRFYFVEFHPNVDPVHGLLQRWLEDKAPHMAWVARAVDRANELLNDRHAVIGPSHFMVDDLDQAMVERKWKHSVLPHIEEHFFDQPGRLSEFNLATLRGLADGSEGPEEGVQEDYSGVEEQGDGLNDA